MENRKINIAEILIACPKGMELDCAMYDNVEFDGFADDEFLPIRCRFRKPDGTYNVCYFTKYGCWDTSESAKCVIFPQGKNTWEGFVPPCEFKNGDIISDALSTCIFKGEGVISGTIDYYCGVHNGHFFVKQGLDGHWGDIVDFRLAIEEEKAKLFQAIKENGYRWNAETKTLEELPKFKNGDILAAGDWVFIFKELHTNGSPRCYCHYDLTLKEFKVDTNSYMACGGDIYLATKEQQDLLFSKMEGAGYKWNAETKTLEKLIKPRFKVGDTIQDKAKYKVKITEVNTEDRLYGFESLLFKGNGCFSFAEQDNWELVFNVQSLMNGHITEILPDVNFFPKDKTVCGGFKDGDVVSAIIGIESKWIGIFKQYEDKGTFETYCSLNALGEFHNTNTKKHVSINTHLASEEEKQKLFQAIKDNGYKWNSETKTLEKLIEPKFKI